MMIKGVLILMLTMMKLLVVDLVVVRSAATALLTAVRLVMQLLFVQVILTSV